MIGSLVDRYGDPWRMTSGASSAGISFVLLSQVGAFMLSAPQAPHFSASYDAAGSYMAAFVAFVLALGFAAIMSVAVRPPQKIQPSKLSGRKQPGSC
jgi:hypothetical protein